MKLFAVKGKNWLWYQTICFLCIIFGCEHSVCLKQYWDVCVCCSQMDFQVPDIKFIFIQYVFLNFIILLTSVCFAVPVDESPEIIGPDSVQIKTHPGDTSTLLWYYGLCFVNSFLNGSCMDLFCLSGALLVLHCDALFNCEDDVTLIYWLVNGNFPEDDPNSNRMTESNVWVFYLRSRWC